MTEKEISGIAIPKITYKKPEYTMDDMDKLFQKIDTTNVPEELIRIRKEQIMNHSNCYFIIYTFNELFDMIGQIDNEYNRTRIEQLNQELIELHTPLYLDLPNYVEYSANPKFYHWEEWSVYELYDNYFILCMRKNWSDFYSCKDRTSFKKYEILDMLNDLLCHTEIIGYDARSFNCHEDFLGDMPNDGIIAVKILEDFVCPI